MSTRDEGREKDEALTSPYPAQGRDAPRPQEPHSAAAPRGFSGWALATLLVLLVLLAVGVFVF